MKLNINLTVQSIICAVLVMAAIVGLCAIFSFAFELKLILEIISCAATVVTAIGVLFAYSQLKLNREIAVSQFENQLFMEYRRIIEKLPSSVMQGEEVTDYELAELADDFYMYIDLTNEQINLRMSDKITKETWIVWRDGIKSNFSLPSFKKSWGRIKQSTSNFQELRRLENEGFMSDPIIWGCK